MQIDGRRIAAEEAPYVIAELSGNHGGSLDKALAIVDALAGTGVDAIKLQTYTADTMTLDRDGPGFVIDDAASLWHGRRLYDLYAEASTPWEWHQPIFDRVRSHGMSAFSTPFDRTAVDFLESLEVPCYKIASFEITDLPLIEDVSATGKPLILSTGLATAEEILRAVDVARSAGASDILLLVCTSAYPAPPEVANLATIPHLHDLTGCPVGLSDHSLGFGVAVAAAALGAVAVEKHVRADGDSGTVDGEFSLDASAFSVLVREMDRARRAVGAISYGPAEAERPSLHFRRSLYLSRDVAAGHQLANSDIVVRRPALGLTPVSLNWAIGRPLARDAEVGEPLTPGMFQ